MNRERAVFIVGTIGSLVILLVGLVVSSWGAHTNDRADPSVWIDKMPLDETGYVYKEDPCVEALRGAMERMEPFIPTMFQREGEFWYLTEYLTADAKQEHGEARQQWEETKLQCFRH